MLQILTLTVVALSGILTARVSGLPSDDSVVARYLSGRQTTGPVTTPPQCQSNCGPALALFPNGCNATLCCTETFNDQLFNCLECVGEADNATDFTQAQQTYDTLVTNCGGNITQHFFPGQGGDNSTSTAPGGSTTSGAPTTTGGQSTVTSLPTQTTTNSNGGQSTVSAPTTSSTAGSSAGFRAEVPWLGGATLLGGWVFGYLLL